MSYREALKRLEAYEPRRLIRGEYEHSGDYCALTAVVPALSALGTCAKSIKFVDAKWRNLVKHSGLTMKEAARLQDENDCGPDDEWPEERFVRVRTWLRARVTETRGAERSHLRVCTSCVEQSEFCRCGHELAWHGSEPPRPCETGTIRGATPCDCAEYVAADDVEAGREGGRHG